MNKSIIIIILLFSCQNSFGAAQSIHIIDRNNNQSIRDLVQKPALIGVFGATPRLSAFQKYSDTVRADFSALQEQQKKNKRLKGIAHHVKQNLALLEKNPGLAEFDEYLKTADHNEQMDLFFDAGFDHESLAQNAALVLKTASTHLKEKRSAKNPQDLYLAHILLPSYFTDLPHLKEHPEKRNLLHRFLKRSALFYKKLYANHPEELTICLIIPPLDHFMHALEKPESDKLLMNATVVQKELIANSGLDHGYILLNQNGPELVPMVTYLQKQGTPKIGGAVIPIQNQQGMPSIIFNPYLLQKGQKHLVSTSPLINQRLVAYVQKRTAREEKKNEE